MQGRSVSDCCGWVWRAPRAGPSELRQFQQLSGDAILAEFGKARTCIGGFISAAAELGDYAIVPTYFAIATPSGTISAVAYRSMRQRLLDSIRSVRPRSLLLRGGGCSSVAGCSLNVQKVFRRT